MASKLYDFRRPILYTCYFEWEQKDHLSYLLFRMGTKEDQPFYTGIFLFLEMETM
jgi:hypothetical protein